MSQPLSDVSSKYDAYENMELGNRLFLARTREQFLREQLRATYAELNSLRQQLNIASQEVMHLQNIAGEHGAQ